MKKIALYFYSCANLGDDLFVKVFADRFSDCRIRLVGNPKCVPKGLGKHVRLHPHSWLKLVLGKLQVVFGETGRIGTLAGRCNDWCLSRIARSADAYVYIGGSVFMRHDRERPALDFSVSERPEFAWDSIPQETGNAFVIGANLGPLYTEDYWEQIKGTLGGYTHVCLRDWASYSRVRELRHVQYAPDVLFLVPKPPVEPREENVVISVVDMAGHTADRQTVDAYYRLMADSVRVFHRRNIPVTLVSFCDWEGDTRAANRVLELVPEARDVRKLCYGKDAEPVLEAMAGASYVIGSRFHAAILGLSFGKPVFPIAYNCKLEHYLQDLGFAGRYANLENMTRITVEDVLYNYDQRIVTDCADHHRYAENQFRGLEQFLSLRETAKP